MTLIEAAQKALEALEYALPFDGANGEIRGAITDLRTAIETTKKQDGWVLREVLFDEGEPIAHREPEKQEPVATYTCGVCGVSMRMEAALPAAQPSPAPSSWVETVAVNLVREGINKHKARELAAHFHELAQQPAAQQGPMPDDLIESYEKGFKDGAAQRQPLTEERLLEILRSVDADTKRLPPGVKAFARGVEEAHNIKEKSNGN